MEIADGQTLKLNWNKSNLQFYLQAYMLGCSFNSFDRSWTARSYIIVLIFLAWVLPLFVISRRYYCIIHFVRNNNFVSANATAEEERARRVSLQGQEAKFSGSSTIIFLSFCSAEKSWARYDITFHTLPNILCYLNFSWYSAYDSAEYFWFFAPKIDSILNNFLLRWIRQIFYGLIVNL